MGKPGWGHAQSLRSEHIGPVEATRGIETSQYPEEKKAICDSLSSGERNGMSLNPYQRDSPVALLVGGCGSHVSAHRCRAGVTKSAVS